MATHSPTEGKQYQRRNASEESNPSAISQPLASSDYPEHRLIVDGHHVPYIELLDITSRWEVDAPSSESGEWADEGLRLQKAAVERGERIFNLTLDNRFGHTATEGEIERWAWFMAHAMSVSAGYTSHGQNSRPVNRHGPSRA